MKVERSTKDQVSSRLEALAKEKENASKKLLDPDEEGDFFDVVKAKDEEAKRRKEERTRKRKELRKEKKEAAKQPAVEEKSDAQNKEGGVEEVEEGGLDPALAAMMGFSGFGGGSKNH
jgi:U4/U6.U5 tri-snRNP component SNU23